MARPKPGDLAHHNAATGKRIRKARLTAGLTQEAIADAVGLPVRTLASYEVGTRRCPSYSLPGLAAAIGCPIASLFVDEVVLAEVRVSPETLERVKREGQPAAAEVAQRIAANLQALLIAESTRPPVDLSPGARPRRRRTRAELLAAERAAEERKRQGIAAAQQGARRNRAIRQLERQSAAA